MFLTAMLTISQLASRFGLSRSTLLYYDSIGLLCPAERTSAGYRLYSNEDVVRMERIHAYRAAGLPLTDIAEVLDAPSGSAAEILEARLAGLNAEIQNLRRQQRTLIALLRDRKALDRSRSLDKDRWVEILRATGLDDDDMERWHAEFERASPEAHEDFLEALGLEEPEISEIRRRSR